MTTTDELPTLTYRQERVLTAIQQHRADKGWAPSIRELCDALDYDSTSTVHGHLRRLEQKGYITTGPGSRMLRVEHGPLWRGVGQ